MRDIKKNSGTTRGQVISANSAMGWLWTAEFGNQDRPRIRYHSPTGTEMILEVTTSSVLPNRSYRPGETVEVLYEATRPGRAYVTREWMAAVNDIWIGSGALIVAIALWIIGYIYSLPF